jgi:hypothetical protein
MNRDSAERAVRWTILGLTALLFLSFGLYLVVGISRELAGLPPQPLVRSGVQSMTICNKGPEYTDKHLPEGSKGLWYANRNGDCTTDYQVIPEE